MKDNSIIGKTYHLSQQCLLGIKLKNPNKSGDMAEILQEFQQDYVPRKGDHLLKPIILHGDVGTEERGRHVQWTYRLGESRYKQLKGIDLTYAEFHQKMCLYEVSTFFLRKLTSREWPSVFCPVMISK